MFNEADMKLLYGAGGFVAGVTLLLMSLRDPNSKSAAKAKQLWLSTKPEKRWAEEFFLYYSLTWISWFAVVVVSRVWENFGPWSYMICGLAMAVPCVAAPFWLEPQHLKVGHVTSRYWFKANVWIAIFSYVGNYFWTHYFYTLLGASYTFHAHRINDVPIAMFLMTHAYFCTYHTVTTATLRRWWTSKTFASVPTWAGQLGTCALVFVLAYITAVTEGVTIQNFPYYAIQDRTWFYFVGSFVYGLYFVVSFPMYARLDEVDCGNVSSSTAPAPPAVAAAAGSKGTPGRAASPAGNKRRGSVSGKAAARVSTADAPSGSSSSSGPHTCGEYALDSLAAAMLVTILLDLWRLGYAWAQGREAQGMLPWVPK